MEFLLGFSVIISIYCYIASIIFKNASQMDKFWGIVPIIYSWYIYTDTYSIRILYASTLITFWGVRLQLALAGKGYFNGTEDYRWTHLREKMGGGLKWHLFNLGMVCFISALIEVGMVLPLYYAS